MSPKLLHLALECFAPYDGCGCFGAASNDRVAQLLSAISIVAVVAGVAVVTKVPVVAVAASVTTVVAVVIAASVFAMLLR